MCYESRHYESQKGVSGRHASNSECHLLQLSTSVDPATRQLTTWQETLSYCSVARAKSCSFQLPTTAAPTTTEGRAPRSKVLPSSSAALCSPREMPPACSPLLVAVALSDPAGHGPELLRMSEAAIQRKELKPLSEQAKSAPPAGSPLSTHLAAPSLSYWLASYKMSNLQIKPTKCNIHPLCSLIKYIMVKSWLKHKNCLPLPPILL